MVNKPLIKALFLGRGTLEGGRLTNPCCLGYIRDTTKLYWDYKKLL